MPDGEVFGVVFQATQIIFAVAIVAAFASLTFGLTRPDSPVYLLTNLISAAGLAVTAVLAFQLGFVITNVLWAAVSAASLARLARNRRQS